MKLIEGSKKRFPVEISKQQEGLKNMKTSVSHD
jgi:hypothetical protein